MESKRFSKNDNGFICVNCGKEVLPLGFTSRNHCPFCLCSLHVDINPGDRANDCGGILRPIQTLPDPKKGFVIIHRCDKNEILMLEKYKSQETTQCNGTIYLQKTCYGMERTFAAMVVGKYWQGKA